MSIDGDPSFNNRSAFELAAKGSLTLSGISALTMVFLGTATPLLAEASVLGLAAYFPLRAVSL